MAPLTESELDPFYTQGCSVGGLLIVASGTVDPRAISIAADELNGMLSERPDVLAAMANSGIHLGVIGRNQRLTEMPEYRDLYAAFPDTDWDNRARGLGATVARPLTTGAEENLLCLAEDRYLGEDIWIHEVAHSIHQFGLVSTDPGFEARLFAAYDAALQDGRWGTHYAMTDAFEYWAEGVQSYFDANLEEDPPGFQHNEVNTRAELADFDPTLHDLIATSLGTPDWRPSCP